MILFQRWSGRIMSEPLGKLFFPPEHIFGQNVSAKCQSFVFWKINLSKLTLFFSNFPCYTKTYEKIDIFFYILDSKKHM